MEVYCLLLLNDRPWLPRFGSSHGCWHPKWHQRSQRELTQPQVFKFPDGTQVTRQGSARGNGNSAWLCRLCPILEVQRVELTPEINASWVFVSPNETNFGRSSGVPNIEIALMAWDGLWKGSRRGYPVTSSFNFFYHLILHSICSTDTDPQQSTCKALISSSSPRAPWWSCGCLDSACESLWIPLHAASYSFTVWIFLIVFVWNELGVGSPNMKLKCTGQVG